MRYLPPMRLLPADVPSNLPAYLTADPRKDVPIHRGSVGAMALAAGSQALDNESQFRPYIYRGTGEDVYETAVVEPEKPKKRKRKKTKRRVYYVVPQRLHYRPELPRAPYAPATWTPKPKKPKKPKPAPIRPSAGWRATTGDDIDRLLEELDMDE